MSEHALRARKLAEGLLDRTVSVKKGEDSVTLLGSEFGFDRAALEKHWKQEELDPGRYDYLIAASYITEIPMHIALAQARLKAAKTAEDRESTWSQARQTQLKLVKEFIDEASDRLSSARRHKGRFKWTWMLLRMRRAALDSANGNDKSASGSAKAKSSTRRRLAPLGYGDLKFMLSTSAAAMEQLSYANDIAVYLFDEDDDELVGNDIKAITLAQEFLLRLQSEKEPGFEGLLPIAAALALVHCESITGEHRLSRDAMLIRSKIYLLRAVVYLAQAIVARRADADPDCIVTPEKKRGQTVAEQRFAMLMARSCVNTAGELAREVKTLHRHDFFWRLFGADLRINLGAYSVLPNRDLDGVVYLIGFLSTWIERFSRRMDD